MAKTRNLPRAKKKLGGPRVAPDGPRLAKVETVKMVAERLQSSQAVLLTEYRGLKVGDLKELRASLKKVDTDYKIVKNTLASIAVRQVGLDDLTSMLQGPVAIAFVGGDVVQAAKQITDYAKKAPTLALKGGVLSGKILSEAQAKALANLESREVLLAKTVGMMAAPLQQMANLFAAPLRNLGSALAQLRDKLPAEPAA